MAATRLLLRADGRLKRSFRDPEALTAKLLDRRYPAAATVPGRLTRLCAVEQTRIGGHTVFTLTPKVGGRGAELIYTHGGAYVNPLVRPHWALLRSLIAASGVTVTVPLYGLAPEHSVEDAIPFLQGVYEQVLVRSRDRRPYLGGDSSGGALALIQARRYRTLGLPEPAGLVLVSPWVDVTMTNPAIPELEKRDPTLAAAGMAAAGRLWAGARGGLDPDVSPLFADMSGLPDVRIVQGDRDILAADADLLDRRLRDAGVHVETRLYPGAFHVFVGAPTLPESRDALSWLASMLR
jgi:RND superfamily putative drug exporter